MKSPRFWDSGLDPRSREAAPLTRALLTPLSALYVWGLRRKLKRAKSFSAPVPVICIGNLTVGGVGKTPIVRALRQRLTRRGLRAASLSRGYGGTLHGPLMVQPSQHTARDVGDEPLMLAQDGESWIGRDRPEAATAMAADGVDVIIMDDGHQNPSLQKTLSLVTIDSEAPFGNGYCLPKGPLREPVKDGLARADAVFLVGPGARPKALEEGKLSVLRVILEPVAAPPDGPLVAFAGIGRPEKFFDSLSSAGADVKEAVAYGDHHAYSQGDLKFLRQLAADYGARLITTDKDIARLATSDRDGLLTWSIEAVFEDAEGLDALLDQALVRTVP